MLGGELAFDWRLADRRSAYLRLARGYKAGGFNVSLAGVDFGTVDNVTLSPENIEFDAESLTSIEAGFARIVGRRPAARRRRRVRRAARRSADQSAVAVAARRSVVVPVRDGELRARRAPRRRSHGRVAGDAAPRAVGRSRLAASRDRRVLAVPRARGPRAGARAGVHVLARRDLPHAVGLVGAARPLRHGRVLLRLRPRSDVASRTARELERRPRLGLVERQALGAQPVRRGLLRARLLLRQRAAGFSADAVHAARRSAALRNHRRAIGL